MTVYYKEGLTTSNIKLYRSTPGTPLYYYEDFTAYFTDTAGSPLTFSIAGLPRVYAYFLHNSYLLCNKFEPCREHVMLVVQ